MNPYILGGGASAAACTTPTTGDTMNSGWEDGTYNDPTTYGSGWGTYGDPTAGATLTAGSPTGSCSKGLKISKTGDGSGQMASWDNGSTISRSGDMDIVFSLYITSNISLPDSDSRVILMWSAIDDWSTGAGLVTIGIYKSGTTYSLRVNVDTFVTITTQEWHTVTIHLDGTAASSFVKIDAGSENAFTRGDANDGRYLHIGALWPGVAVIEYEIGYVYINTP